MEEGHKGEKKWDNCNSIINKIYLEKVLIQCLVLPVLLRDTSVNQTDEQSSPPSNGKRHKINKINEFYIYIFNR